LGFDVGEFVHISLGQADEEYVKVPAADTDDQTFTAVLTKDHAMGATVRPTVWPTAVLNEGDSLAFDILGVACPDPAPICGGDPDVNWAKDRRVGCRGHFHESATNRQVDS